MTVFSPNGDGVNEKFLPFAGPEVASFESFSVYNRWGEQVYEAENFPPGSPDVGWDGTFRGEELNPGVFVYQAKVQMIDGITVVFEGDVVLLR
jgi:gliding motility-associated-like protein